MQKDLFTAASVFIGPAMVCAVLSVAWNFRLLTNRITQRKAVTAASSVAREAKQKRLLQKHLLRVLAARFVLQHDVLEYADAKRANDRDRYEGYGNMLRVLTEADPPHRLTDIPSAGIVESDRGVRAFIAVCTAALPHASPVRPPCCHFLALNHFRAL